MRLVRELEVWGRPGRIVTLEDADRLVASLGAALGLPGDVLIPHHWVAGDIDVDNLSSEFADGTLTATDFERFCAAHDLPADTGNAESAAWYLAFAFGQTLAWLHLPAEHDTAATLAHLARRLAERECVLGDPDELLCLLPTGQSLDL